MIKLPIALTCVVMLSGCEYGDKVLGCDSSLCPTYFTNGVAYSFMCCGTCANTQECADTKTITTTPDNTGRFIHISHICLDVFKGLNIDIFLGETKASIDR